LLSFFQQSQAEALNVLCSEVLLNRLKFCGFNEPSACFCRKTQVSNKRGNDQRRTGKKEEKATKTKGGFFCASLSQFFDVTVLL